MRARSLTRHARRQTDTTLRPQTTGGPRPQKSQDVIERPATADNDDNIIEAEDEPNPSEEISEKAPDNPEKSSEEISEKAPDTPEKSSEDLEDAPPSPGPSPSPSAPPKELLTDSEAGSNKGEEEEENLDDTIAINNISSGSMVQVN